MKTRVVTRFAPSPTGYLHIGHAHAALFAWRAARAAGGRFLLRIEDIDQARCRSEFATAIEEDLAWLGLDWDGPVIFQSARMGVYEKAIQTLRAMDLLYPCFCTRKDIQAEIERAGRAPHGPEGPLYPGLCRELDTNERARRLAGGAPHALRLDIAKASARAGALEWHDRGLGKIAAEPAVLGDVVIARKGIGASYHLAATVDDASQGVTLITRGEDLVPATHVHRLLQALLGLPVPKWHHHRLIADGAGMRLSKRHKALSIRALRTTGESPAAVRARAGFAD